jgi:phytoene dehydrogenase-like protein
MTKHFDVIVIGAGLGGLSAATMLARNGLGVLLLERHNVPGGYATSFVRSRALGEQPYEFEVALHELSGIGPPERRGAVYRYLEYLGMADKVEFLHVPSLYRSVFLDPTGWSPSGLGLDVTLPPGREAFEAKLCRTFPHESRGIKRFMDRVFKFGRDFARILRKGRKAIPALVPVQHPHFFRYLPTTWGQVLDRDVKDPSAKAVLSQYWGYVGLPPSKISFVYMASTLAAYVRRGAAFPKGRSQALSNAFLAQLEQLGGEARMNCSVERIMVANGQVTGVITEGGERISTDWIVSNADPITTSRELVGWESVPSSFFARLQSSEVAPSTVNVYLGLACPPEDLGLIDHEIFVNTDSDFERHAERMRVVAPPESIAVTCYNVVYPDISPPGTSMVVLTALAHGEPWSKVRPSEYVRTKNRIANAMIDMAEPVAPGLRRQAEVVEVSTPLTNMRYTGTSGGSIYGFSQPPRDNMVWRMPHRGPLDGLYFAGAWTRPGGGYEPTIMSGQMAGRAIISEIKKRSSD